MGRNSKAPEEEKHGLLRSFVKIFLVVFVIFLVVLTPLQAVKDKIINWQPFQSEGKLSEQLNFDYLVDQKSPLYSMFKDSNRVNVLALGVNGGMTDVMMLVSYDLDRNHVDVISIPRDTYYPRNGYSLPAAKKINAVYSSKNGGGAAGAAKAVSDILQGMPINYYMVVDYNAVEKIVTAIGGVPMDIPFHMVYNDPYDKPPLHINIQKGQQVLDGKKAVQFLRYRHGYPEGDIGRIKAHQQFIKSAFHQALSGANLYKVVKTTLNEVKSDINVGLILKVAKKAVNLKEDDLETWMVPGNSGMREKLSFWNADKEKTKEMVQEIYSGKDSTTTESSVKK